MLLHHGWKFIPKTLTLLLALMVSAALIPTLVNAQRNAKRLTKQDVIDLLTGDVSSDDVAKESQKAGISFQVTPSVETEIRAAGGSDPLINVLRSLAPAAPVSPPSTLTTAVHPELIIEANPGQSQVYVDDEPVGTTSREGRLKLTRLTPGPHTVRISMIGYQDHEEKVTLTVGSKTTVAALLQKAQAAQIPSPPPQPQPPPQPEPPYTPVTPPATSGHPGYLGILVMEQQPVGAHGVVLSGADPNGPGAQIGLKAYDTVLAVNGQAVTTPDALRTALSSHPPGEAVNITWYNGSSTVTKQARLVSYPGNQVIPQQVTPPSLNPLPHTGFQTFYVAHDHGQGGQNYCAGMMSIGNGMIYYKGVKGNGPVHTFEIPLNTVKEARRNGIYLLAMGAFHIKLRRGTNYNFVALNQQGQFQPPETILNAIDAAMGR